MKHTKCLVSERSSTSTFKLLYFRKERNLSKISRKITHRDEKEKLRNETKRETPKRSKRSSPRTPQRVLREDMLRRYHEDINDLYIAANLPAESADFQPKRKPPRGCRRTSERVAEGADVYRESYWVGSRRACGLSKPRGNNRNLASVAS